MVLGILTLLGCSVAFAAPLPADWQHTQSFEVATPGLLKISVPVATLDAARPGLDDLRLYDNAGNEVPYSIERPVPAAKTVQAAKSFQVSLRPPVTVITIETGLAQAVDAVTLDTPAREFIKAVRVEGSEYGRSWVTLAEGRPIFRQPSGASQLQVMFQPHAARWLRLTVDDRRSPPVPFTGGRVHAAAPEAVPVEAVAATVTERDETPGQTRLTLNLGAANLDVAVVRIETPEPLFMRSVTLAVPQIVEDAWREHTVGQGVVYRVAVEGQPATDQLSVPLETRVRARELILTIHNQDNPALPVSAVRVERRPVYLVLHARAAGSYHLLAGNTRCAAPRYDLASLGANLKNVPVTGVAVAALTANPGYRPPEALPGLEPAGAALDVAAWRYRKAISPGRTGAQQVELDLEVLAHAAEGFSDLRVMRGSNQVPFLLQRPSIHRALTPSVALSNDAKRPSVSRWLIRLPHAGLPVTRLSCRTATPLFQRELTLYEEATNQRGEQYRRPLGRASWVQTPERQVKSLVLTLDGRPQTDALFLETENGDNPPIQLEQFEMFYPAVRVQFKARADDPLHLYYGNPRASAPRYDLNLVASQLLAAEKAAASLGDEETLKPPSWAEGGTPGRGGVIFWGILALVVVGLLVILARLLPKSPAVDQNSG